MFIFQITLLIAAAVAQSCPPWQLPWDLYTGTLDPSETFCLYSNVRFASPPTGMLRFAAPQYPPQSTPAIPGPNPVCPQMNETSCLASRPVIGGAAECYGAYYGTESEDCLFLDVYVPVGASGPLPVVVWIYGGAYVFGSKTAYDPSKLPFYSGNGLINSASYENEDNNITSFIFVAGNYRLGAFGWLAGEYMENNGQPNAGLLDQRAVLQFVQDRIASTPNVPGNPQNVSVWGESAGASSIMHHLAMPPAVGPPLFNKALVQSPAYPWLWDRKGGLNDTFTDFATQVASLAGCTAADMACIRSADTSILQSVNQGLFQDAACNGIMPVGPAVDGNLVPSLATYRFYQNATNSIIGEDPVTVLDTIIVSHVDLEVPYSASVDDWSFIPLPIRNNSQNTTIFRDFLATVFGYDTIVDAVEQQYPSSSYSDQIARAAAVIADSSFLCNTRFMIQSYSAQQIPVYAMDYAILTSYNASTHGSDLLPTFANSDTSYTDLIECVVNIGWAKATVANRAIVHDTRPGLQQYFTDHAIWGDPNYNSPSYNWNTAYLDQCPNPKSATDTCIQNLMKPQEALVHSVFSYNDEIDTQTSNGTCDFWGKVVNNITLFSTGGHSMAAFSGHDKGNSGLDHNLQQNSDENKGEDENDKDDRLVSGPISHQHVLPEEDEKDADVDMEL